MQRLLWIPQHLPGTACVPCSHTCHGPRHMPCAWRVPGHVPHAWHGPRPRYRAVQSPPLSGTRTFCHPKGNVPSVSGHPRTPGDHLPVHGTPVCCTSVRGAELMSNGLMWLRVPQVWHPWGPLASPLLLAAQCPARRHPNVCPVLQARALESYQVPRDLCVCFGRMAGVGLPDHTFRRATGGPVSSGRCAPP